MLASYGLQMSTNPITLQRSHAQYFHAITSEVVWCRTRVSDVRRLFSSPLTKGGQRGVSRIAVNELLNRPLQT